jgi:hypothetical protein
MQTPGQGFNVPRKNSKSLLRALQVAAFRPFVNSFPARLTLSFH